MRKSSNSSFSRPQQQIIDVLAHIMAAGEIARNVEGMEGFFDEYLKKGLTPSQQAIWKALQDRSRQVKKDLCQMLKEEREQEKGRA
jgi:hypothetical protein